MEKTRTPNVLRSVWVFRGRRIEKCRLIEVKKGMLFSMKEPTGEYVEGVVWWRATSETRALPPPAMCALEAEAYEHTDTKG